jgi:hypothetical protein
MRFGNHRTFSKKILLSAFITGLVSTTISFAQNYNLGVSVYPGNPKENYSPSINIDNKTYRNIALLRPVYGSSSYDFNLTPQLLTDGIIENLLPGWIVTTTNHGILPRYQREYFIDRNPGRRMEFEEKTFWIQTELAGNSELPEVDGFKFSGNISIDTLEKEIKPWKFVINGSNDGKVWKQIAVLTDNKLLGDTLTGFRRAIYPRNYRLFSNSIKLENAVCYKYYRADISSQNIESWRFAEFALMNNDTYCNIGGPYNFSSSWKSLGSNDEWIYIDLGSVCSFDKVDLYWLKRAESSSIQISDDAKTWKTISALPSNTSTKDEIKFDKFIQARYVKLTLDRALSDDGYILSEIEIYGTGAHYAAAHPQAEPDSNGNVILSGGAWKLQRTSFINDDLNTISQIGYDDKNWIVATVPGTVLISYLNNDMIPDPNYSDNQFLISDSYFYSDFIYRDEFTAPISYEGKKVFLNLDGINWKAEVYLNGGKIGRVEGAFTCGKFDVTENIIPGKKNAIAVYIYKNDSPGFIKEPTFITHQANGGQLGLDNPTFHASVGWDWLPSTRGRNIGIWNEIYFSISGDVTIEDPFITSKLLLQDTTSADLKIRVTLNNHSAENVNGTLKGKIGDVKFETPISLSSSEIKTINLDPSIISSLHINNPKLWWPNGYGEQNLYDVNLEFVSSDGKIFDTKEFKTGIREMTYSEDGGALKIWVNGKRFIARGGNWGFSESNLRYRSREYDIAVRYHKEMNLNMLRNWVGQTGDDEFYEACDKYGIVVWQDFWLANPVDGPDPKDNKLFMRNAEDFVKRIRNHPSIGLYCGRNEGYPPEEIDNSLRALLPQITPGIHYISSSADDIVSGHGPYHYETPKYYFQKRATPLFHSEIGLPSPVSLESLKMMMPDSSLWPINLMWGIHDFSMESAQEGEGFMKTLENNFGKVDNAKDWLGYSQWLSYEGYRAILEAQGKNRMGVLFWMTHCAWPSLVFQTYDYYFEPTGAYYGCKKGSEPLHIQWNAFADSIEVVNYSILDGSDLTATVELINLDGSVKMKKQFPVDCSIDHIKRICKLEQSEGLSNTYFIRLNLEKENKLISENFYWNGLQEENYQEITKLPKAKLDVETRSIRKDGKWFLTTELSNNTKTPVPMVRLKVVGSKDKERILPVIFSDNFISLMPGEKRTVEIEIDNSDTRGNKPQVEIEGVNIE